MRLANNQCKSLLIGKTNTCGKNVFMIIVDITV